VDLCWYDGGMRPPTPAELQQENKELPAEGRMFGGDKGRILAGFNLQNPQIISGQKLDVPPIEKRPSQEERTAAALALFIDACKTGKQYPGNFTEAEYITEAINLYAVSLRTGRTLKYDAANVKITNVPEANKWLDREYRTGWDLASI
jgi:hypothetical protein